MGFRELQNTITPRLLQLQRRSRNMRPLFRVIAEVLAQSSQKTIEVGGRPAKFQRLAAATLLARAGGAKRAFKKKGGIKKRAHRIFATAQPLLDTTQLLRSMTGDADGQRALWGSGMVQARLLNSGGMAGRGHLVKVPGREFIGPDQPFPEDLEAIEAAVNDHLEVGK